MKRNLHTVDRAVVREADFDGDVEASVIVGVRIEGEGDGKVSVRVKKDFGLREVLRQRGGLGAHGRKLPRRRDVKDRLAIVRFRADGGDDRVGCGDQAG